MSRQRTTCKYGMCPHYQKGDHVIQCEFGVKMFANLDELKAFEIANCKSADGYKVCMRKHEKPGRRKIEKISFVDAILHQYRQEVARRRVKV